MEKLDQSVYSPSPTPEVPRNELWRMFDRIAQRYDLLNRLLSFGQDVVWRKKLARFLPEGECLEVLDLATGTADVIIYLFQKSARVFRAVGIDLAERMLEIGQQKIREHQLDQVVELKVGDATRIPFPDNQFHVVTIAFGIRNVENVPQSLREMYRVLKPGGRALVLEFSLPRSPIVRNAYLFYFRNILPRIGGWISGDHYAYQYLNKTVESFPYGESFAQLMTEAGFSRVGYKSLTFGVATIYYGDKLM
ncbi:MAG: bifunctional demethylmenaquinone methyltransferase/2-methoxy-6-polyprenyl-1,4-benzoquinol methylase UbiE [Calditrichaeota bacterium]|nr:bifunctional demethylmenaquinone methyltransferase/2-methoxy-6-polyprenyl-1,4-benzoquinol methylase UbiE [Calditrichota bacterium]